MLPIWRAISDGLTHSIGLSQLVVWYEIYVLSVLVATGVDIGECIVHTSDIHVLHTTTCVPYFGGVRSGWSRGWI